MQRVIPFLILYCTCTWEVSLSGSLSFNLINRTVVKNTNAKTSKYIYKIDHDDSKRMQFPVEEPITSTSYATKSTEDVCNASFVGEYKFRRRKRSIGYFQNSTTTESSRDVDLSILSEEFRNCTHTTVEPECYVLFPNGIVYVPLYKMYFNRSNYVINEDLLFVCPNFFRTLKEKFHSAIGIVSVVGVAVSTLFIILHIIMFLLVEKLRNLPGYCLLSLCISLLIAYINFFIQLRISEHAECKVNGIILMCSFLSSFFWMNVISFDVWHSIRLATSKLLLSTNRSILRRFGMYSCYAWGIPVLILIIALIVDNTSESVEYQLVFRRSTCWFQYKQALLVYFALPLFVVLSLNIFFFFSSFHMIARSRSDSGCQEAYDLRSRLFLSLRLGVAMGLMWIFGVIDTVTHQEWISYLQSIFNALQGVLIFFSFNFNQRTKNACKEAIRKKKSSLLSTVPSQMTTKFLN